mmetsp:Transcript_9634/g.29009  ORF Transcript_9634/g.29009 Transcript_9634/m.29009 type:complete len:232 (-) Transcript_9634:582-1277(-)
MAQMSMSSMLTCDRPLVSPTQRVFRPFTVRSRPARTVCHASQSAPDGASADRRQVLQMAGMLAASQLVSAAPAQAKVGGFVPYQDQGDAYKLVYPFGWQEVSVGGQDVVFKDIIEPLESVSVSLADTDKDDITLFGSPAEVAYSLADKVLTPPTQPVKVLKVTPKRVEDRNYVEFEFAAKSNTYIRLAIAVVTVANGKLYTLVTGANEQRWDKVKPKLEVVAGSFVVSTKY